MDNEETIEKEPSSVSSRIPDGLREDLRNSSEYGQDADFVFVKEMNPVGEDLVEVVFEEPFRSEDHAQKYKRPNVEEAYSFPELEELYEAADADLSEPASILSTSVPTNAPGVLNQPRSGIATDVDWIPEGLGIYEKEQKTTSQKAITYVSGLATLVLTYIMWSFSPILAVGGFILGTLVFLYLSGNKYKKPAGSTGGAGRVPRGSTPRQFTSCRSLLFLNHRLRKGCCFLLRTLRFCISRFCRSRAISREQ